MNTIISLVTETAPNLEADALNPSVENIMTAPIQKRCNLLTYVRNNDPSLSEPYLMAVISNLAQCADGQERLHDIMRQYPNYSFNAVQENIERARESKTPMTCKYIQDNLGFKGCRSCPVDAPFDWTSSPVHIAAESVESYIDWLQNYSNIRIIGLPPKTISALSKIILEDYDLYDALLEQIENLIPKLKKKNCTGIVFTHIQKEARLSGAQMNTVITQMLRQVLGFPVNIPDNYFFSFNKIEIDTGPKLKTVIDRLVLSSKRYLHPDGEMVELTYQTGTDYSTVIFPRRTLASSGKLLELATHGVPVDSSNSSSVVQFITQWTLANEQSIPIVNATPYLGWQRDNSFLPGLSPIRLIKKDAQFDSTDALAPSGTLAEWAEIMRPLRPYIGSRLAMAASMAAPLLHLLNIRTFIVHLWGPSRGGKTAAQKAALSLWLNPANYMVSFNSTRIALTRYLGHLRHLPFVINERQQVGDEQSFVDQLIYMLAEGQGRMTSSQGGGVNALSSWQTVVLTSGEHPLTADSSTEGEQTRTMEIFAPSFIDNDALSSSMHSLSEQYYGTAGIAVLKEVLTNQAEISRQYETYRDWIATNHSHILSSYYRYIAVLGLAEKLLSKIVFGHTEEESQVHAMSLINHIISSLNTPTPDHERAYAFLQDWVTGHINRFADGSGNSPGWIKNNDVYFLPNAFDDTLSAANFNPIRVRRDFDHYNLLRRSKNELTSVHKNPFTNRPTRVILLPNLLPGIQTD